MFTKTLISLHLLQPTNNKYWSSLWDTAVANLHQGLKQILEQTEDIQFEPLLSCPYHEMFFFLTFLNQKQAELGPCY